MLPKVVKFGKMSRLRFHYVCFSRTSAKVFSATFERVCGCQLCR